MIFVQLLVALLFLRFNMMWLSALVLAAVVGVHASPVAETRALEKRALPKGMDVSGYQPGINWNTVKANGIEFAYIKATEGTSMLASSNCATGLYTDAKTIQHTPIQSSPANTSGRPISASFAVATTLRAPTSLLAQLKRTSSSLTEVLSLRLALM